MYDWLISVQTEMPLVLYRNVNFIRFQWVIVMCVWAVCLFIVFHILFWWLILCYCTHHKEFDWQAYFTCTNLNCTIADCMVSYSNCSGFPKNNHQTCNDQMHLSWRSRTVSTVQCRICLCSWLSPMYENMNYVSIIRQIFQYSKDTLLCWQLPGWLWLFGGFVNPYPYCELV